MSSRVNTGEKQAELKKYRDLVLAAIDYTEMIYRTQPIDWEAQLNGLRTQVDEHFKKGRLTKLKQWFRDMSEPMIECRDLSFNSYLKEKTNYNVDIFKAYNGRVNKTVAKGRISTDNQFYDIKIMVDYLCQAVPLDKAKIDSLNKLLVEYEMSKGNMRDRYR